MRILLVNPSFPVTYWGFQYALPFSKASVVLPPLGLVTLAALLPKDWELRLVDLNVTALSDDELRWADAVFVGGMRVQAPSMLDVLARARALGRVTVVGGPAPTTSPSEFASADILFQGEAEGRIGELVAALQAPRGAPRLLPNDGPAPEMTESPPPRLDLLDLHAYDTMSLQYSRGCPYRCEFCDIIEIYGRKPRVKAPSQIVAELEALHAAGWRGPVFMVDDNFIGHRPAVRKLLPEIVAFQRRHGHPFQLTTEASVNLAADEALVAEMIAAGFEKVFVGIESPSPDALGAANKTQNLRIDLHTAIESLTRAGLEVMAGFIVGFDQDGPDVFEAQRAFIQASPIPIAMAGLLMALPETQLWRRLVREGRLRGAGSGDQFERPNFEPTLDEAELLRGYAELLGQLYEPAAYFERCRAFAAMAPKVPTPPGISASDLRILARIFWVFGVRRPWRRHFWRLVATTLRHRPYNFRRAMSQAVIGEHMIRYTEEVVRPRIAQALEQVHAERRHQRSVDDARRRCMMFTLQQGHNGRARGARAEVDPGELARDRLGPTTA
jgi:radical SAM superfamily enzyme YgiQ (UPF0313 family)